MKEAILIIVTSALAYLIMVKADQQMLILLKGRLHRFNFEVQVAEGVWKRHVSMMQSALFLVAGALAGVTIICSSYESIAAALTGLGALLCLVLGVVGKVKSFRAADKEIRAMLPPIC